jgi:hypothetical protein
MIAALLAFALPDIQAQATELRGRVVSDSGVPIPNATITLPGIRYSVRSDSLGAFRLSGTPGSTLNLTLIAAGFRDDSATVVLPRSRAVLRDFVMVSETTPLPEPNPSDRVLRGRVTDSEQTPLAYANIQVNGGRRYVSDDSGRFVLPIPGTGAFTLLVRRIGFEPEQVTFDSFPAASVRVQLKAVARALPEQRVTGRAAFVSLDLAGYYGRMRDAERGINHGYFLTPEDFELRKPTLLTNMAEGLPAVRVWHHPLDPKKNMIEGVNRCRMTVYLDRVRIVGKLGNMPDDYVNELIQPTDIAAMEVYPRAVGAPPQYQAMNGTCGVVLIWSK